MFYTTLFYKSLVFTEYGRHCADSTVHIKKTLTAHKAIHYELCAAIDEQVPEMFDHLMQ